VTDIVISLPPRFGRREFAAELRAKGVNPELIEAVNAAHPVTMATIKTVVEINGPEGLYEIEVKGYPDKSVATWLGEQTKPNPHHRPRRPRRDRGSRRQTDGSD